MKEAVITKSKVQLQTQTTAPKINTGNAYNQHTPFYNNFKYSCLNCPIERHRLDAYISRNKIHLPLVYKANILSLMIGATAD